MKPRFNTTNNKRKMYPIPSIYGTYIYIPNFTINKKNTTIHVGSLNIPYMDPKGVGMNQASTTPPKKAQTLCNKQRTPMVSKALVKSFPEFKPQVVKTESQQMFFYCERLNHPGVVVFVFLCVVSLVSHMI